MLRRTVFRSDIKLENYYDYVLIDYDEAIALLKKNKTSDYTTIQEVSNILNSDIKTALAVMGYMYHYKILYRTTPTTYKFNF